MFRLNRNKQKTNRNSCLIESIFCFFSENLGLFRFVSVFFETVLFVSNVSIQVRKAETNRNKPKIFVFGFTKQTKTDSWLTMATPWVGESTSLWLCDSLSQRVFRKIFTVTCMVVLLFLLCYNRNALWLKSLQPAIAEMTAISRTEQQHECQ
jgi:hypothetical protein